MILSKASYGIAQWPSNAEALNIVERAYRVCTNTPPCSSQEAKEQFIQSCINRGHLTPLEHIIVTVQFHIDRGVSHELVRHRLASPSQRSTRFCDSKGGVEFIIPSWITQSKEELSAITYADLLVSNEPHIIWLHAMKQAETNYCELRMQGWKPEQARSVLPNALATEVMFTANIREWRTIFAQRALGLTGRPHPQMVEVMLPLFNKMCTMYPAFFTDMQPQQPCNTKE